VPAVARPGDEPGEGGEPAGDARPHDRRLPADRENVRGDRGQDAQLAHDPREPEEPAEGVDPACEERDVLSGDGQEVVEPGGAEVVLHVRG
jgi:hypothetical protein